MWISRVGSEQSETTLRDRKELHLFEPLGKGRGYRYLGMFACSSWEYCLGIDVNGDERQVIVFHLIEPSEEEQETPSPLWLGAPLEQLRQRVLEAALPAEQSKPHESKGLYYRRSATVRHYVLARAAGVCEPCGSQAPFVRTDVTL
jgi:5-methylcytosine-specific restriction protein A